MHRFEAALRLLDEHCRVYQYLLKRTIAPVRRGAVRAARRARGDPAPRGVPERADATSCYDLVAVPRAALRGAARRPRGARQLGAFWRGPRDGASRLALGRPHACSCSRQNWTAPSARCTTRPRRFEVQLSDIGLDTPRQGRRVSLLPAAGELRRQRPSTRRRLTYDTHLDYFVADSADRVPSRPPDGRRPHRQGAVDEGAAEPDVRAPAAGPVRRSPASSSRASSGSGFPATAMRRDIQSPAPALLQQARLAGQLRVARDAARGDAGRRLGQRDGPPARRRADRAGGQRPLLRQLLADARAARRRTRGPCSTRPPRR